MPESTFKVITRTRVLEPGEYKRRDDALDIFIKDVRVHAQKATNPKSLLRSQLKQRKSGKLQRTFSSGKIRDLGGGRIEAGFGFSNQEIIDICQKQRKTMVRVFMPVDGVPVYLAQDAIEKIQSVQKHLNTK